ncbi:MAG: hypothetical protein ACI8X5_001059 [Planctomycetota bacterium]|jgi:hypothetical protein
MIRSLLLSIGLTLPLCIIPAPIADGPHQQAQDLVAKKNWEEARKLLERHVSRTAGDARAHELLGLALSGLEENDLAAHHLATALELYERSGDKRSASNTTRSLQKVDSVHKKRASLQRDITKKMYEAAEKLFDLGHGERALVILERMQRIATGKLESDVAELLEEVRTASAEVDLDKAGDEREEGDLWPLIEFESKHYILKANLEPDLVQLVAETMDDIHGYYVLLYFDGDAKAAKSSKATIRVHPTREAMLANWQGSSAPEGWWSPGENQVTCYDTRSTTGALEWMLETLFHEASHQFMSLLTRKGGTAPAWLNEGTASFFEGAVAMADHRVLWPDAATKRLRSLVAMLASESKDPSLKKVISYNSPGSYDGSYYPWGWGIVYFMQQYEDEETLEFVYRPLYARYREQITSRGGNTMKLFNEIFIGEDSPLGHETFEDFERDWIKWIKESIAPLHQAPKPERRAKRRALVARYTAAAQLAADDKKAKVSEIDLLTRSLGHIEYIRSKIDGEEKYDVELIGMQADILERQERDSAAAPLVEKLLELADEEYWTPSEEEYAALEKRMQKLDRKNFALRRSESARNSLIRSARKLLESYLKEGDAMQLRAYTFASKFGNALDDTEVLLAEAQRLRPLIRSRGMLFGEAHSLLAAKKNWSSIYLSAPDRFVFKQDSVELSSVRPSAFLNTDTELSDEYQVRATFRRNGELYRSTCHGLVIAGVKEGDWLAFGLLKSGKAGLWRLKLGDGGGVTTKKIETFYLDPKPADDEDLHVVVHVSDQGAIEIHVEDCEPLHAKIPSDMPDGRYAGIYVKDGTTILVDPIVELY